MKRFLIILTLLLCFSLTACGNIESFFIETINPQSDFSLDSSTGELFNNGTDEPTGSTVSVADDDLTEGDSSDSGIIPADSYFEIYYLDVGQGDAAVIICDNHAMMIDGGDNKQSSFIYSFLKSHNIAHLDYIIASHPDADHIGGLSGALNYATVSKAFCTTISYDTKTFQSFIKYLNQQGVKITIPNAGDNYSLGSASFTILAPPAGLIYSDNTSLVIRVKYGDTSFLFTGDAEIPDENNLLSTGYGLSSTVLKVAHHGSSSSTSKSFLEKVNPEYAIISVGGDNTYGHPTETTLSHLHNANVKTFRTDMQGDIHCTSDGTTVSFDCEKHTSDDVFSVAGGYAEWVASQRTNNDNTISIVDDNANRSTLPTYDYVANMNTGKFHYPYCSSVDKMKESNKAFINGTHDDLIAMGYSPCGNCHP